MVRSHRTTELCVAALLLTVAVGACTQPSKRLNAPPQGHTCHPSDMQTFYTPMVDQAMLSDMSMSSVHFVPHQSELNANGVRRLERYATIMKTYGGTLRYDGVDEGEQIQRDRIQLPGRVGPGRRPRHERGRVDQDPSRDILQPGRHQQRRLGRG
jgi:hypothetical protein